MTYSDTNLLKNILNIGRRRERRIYYRPNGEATALLPADPFSQVYYMAKGFTLKPKEDVKVKKSSGEWACPKCEFEAKDAFGLQAHLRKHINKNETKKEETT